MKLSRCRRLEASEPCFEVMVLSRVCVRRGIWFQIYTSDGSDWLQLLDFMPPPVPPPCHQKRFPCLRL